MTPGHRQQSLTGQSTWAPDSPGPAFLSKPHALYLRQSFQNMGSPPGHGSYLVLVPVDLVLTHVFFFTLDRHTVL